MEEINSATDWKSNFVYEPVEKRFETSLTEKITVDRDWPVDMVGIAAADQIAERTAQARQRRQRYIDYTQKGLRPRYLQRRSEESLMEHPNATWNDLSTHLINKNVTYQVSTSFLNDEKQNKAQLAYLGL